MTIGLNKGEIKMTDIWKEEVLKNIPHGHEGQIDLFWDEAVTWAKILNQHGYAVLFTDGDMDDSVRVSWLYAGDIESLDYVDYDNVVFSHMDYFNDYLEAFHKDNEIENFDEDNEDEDEVLPTKPEISE